MTMRRFVMYWALTGILVPVVVIALGELEVVLGKAFLWLDVAIYLWPSWIVAGALEAVHQPWWWVIVVIAISIGTNVVLYSIVGAVLWLLRRLFGRLFRW